MPIALGAHTGRAPDPNFGGSREGVISGYLAEMSVEGGAEHPGHVQAGLLAISDGIW